MKAAKLSAENMPPKALVITWSPFSTRSRVIKIPPMASCVTRRALRAVSPPYAATRTSARPTVARKISGSAGMISAIWKANMTYLPAITKAPPMATLSRTDWMLPAITSRRDAG